MDDMLFQLEREGSTIRVLNFSDQPSCSVGVVVSNSPTMFGTGMALTPREALQLAEALIRGVVHRAPIVERRS